jgi:hypothetical protein
MDLVISRFTTSTSDTPYHLALFVVSVFYLCGFTSGNLQAGINDAGNPFCQNITVSLTFWQHSAQLIRFCAMPLGCFFFYCAVLRVAQNICRSVGLEKETTSWEGKKKALGSEKSQPMAKDGAPEAETPPSLLNV